MLIYLFIILRSAHKEIKWSRIGFMLYSIMSMWVNIIYIYIIYTHTMCNMEGTDGGLPAAAELKSP